MRIFFDATYFALQLRLLRFSVPAAPPGNFRIEKLVNFSSVNFAWELVPESLVKGYFRGYEVSYARVRRFFPSLLITFRSNSGANRFRVVSIA